MSNIKRIAGASAGAIVAALLSIGYDSNDLQTFLEQDLKHVLVGETQCRLIKLELYTHA